MSLDLDLGSSDPDGLRWFQREAYEAILDKLRDHKSVIAVLATGLGKTQLFSAIAKHWPGSVLILAHRDELVDQARDRLEQMTGECVEIEKGQWRSGQARLVVGSLQTLSRASRLERLGAARFSLVIYDEVHHSVARTFRRAFDFFTAKFLGVTATPDRGDAQALGKMWESVAYVMDIEEGVHAGYLVPIVGREVVLDNLDLSRVQVSKGDLQSGQLDDKMAAVVKGVCDAVLEHEPDRQGIGFFPGVRSAELASHAMNNLRPGSTCFVHAKTPTDERKMLVADFKAGKYQYFFNALIATEGFDAPTASLVIQARPTLSRALYAQMAGRATRPLSGVVEAFDEKADAELRQHAISASSKPTCVIMDFVGNAGKHSLMGPEDILGGRYTTDEVAQAKKLKKKHPKLGTMELLEKARAELKALEAKVQVKITNTSRLFNPFRIMGLTIPEYSDYGRIPVSPGQKEGLKKRGLKPGEYEWLSKDEASKLLRTLDQRRTDGLCSYAQMRELRKRGLDPTTVTFYNAGKAMAYLRQMGYGSHPYYSPRALNDIAQGRREAGVDD